MSLPIRILWHFGIQTGDIIAMDPRTVVTESGYIKSRFLDDKLSAAILLGLARAVREDAWKLNRKVSLLFTVYEEVGHGGSVVPDDTEGDDFCRYGLCRQRPWLHRTDGFDLCQRFRWPL